METTYKDEVGNVIKLIYEFLLQLKLGDDFRGIK